MVGQRSHQTHRYGGGRKVAAPNVTLFVVAFLLAACTPVSVTNASTSSTTTTTTAPVTDTTSEYWPTEGWRTAAPEEQGMDSHLLADLFAAIDEESYAIDSVTVIRNGYVVADGVVHPFGKESRHIIHSCTKSIVSALIGIAVEEGYLEGVEQAVLDILPDREIANLDADKEAMTLENVLTMSTGLDCRDSYLYGWRGLSEMRASDDWVQHMLDLPMVAPPGSLFEYCNGGSFLLSAILQEVTEMKAADFARDRLFGPLGITDFVWPESPQGINIGWGELRMRPHDLAKIGYLYLRDGRWENRQVVPSTWVDASTHSHIGGTLQDGYGYQWWVRDDGVYMALGYAGQYLIVVPAHDLVVVFTSDLPEDEFYLPQSLLDNYIIPAVLSEGALPADPEGKAALRAATEALATP
ncbi:MAG: beta-lactamase family protein [Acidimicrobiia bacterium]|nr:beta-lactamase family protein [Acidimicrobiia bacterium]MDH5615944.1 beta-lactamase family protein [Acidimicrobiia bacterium]